MGLMIFKRRPCVPTQPDQTGRTWCRSASTVVLEAVPTDWPGLNEANS